MNKINIFFVTVIIFLFYTTTFFYFLYCGYLHYEYYFMMCVFFVMLIIFGSTIIKIKNAIGSYELTPIHKAGILLKAANYIECKESNSMCMAVFHVMSEKGLDQMKVTELFPELLVYKKEKYWIPYTDEGRKLRIKILDSIANKYISQCQDKS